MASHVSTSATGSISWTDITPSDSADWNVIAVNADGSIMAVSDGQKFEILDGGDTWGAQSGAPGAVSISIASYPSVLGPGPGIDLSSVPTNFNGVNYQLKTAAAAQFGGQSWTSYIEQAASTYNLDPDMIARLLFRESGWNPTLRSSDGGVGIAQWTAPLPTAQIGPIFPLDPQNSIMQAAHYISYLESQLSGNLGLAIGAYNAGLTTIKNYISGTPLPHPEITDPEVLISTGRHIADWLVLYSIMIIADASGGVRLSSSSGASFALQQPLPGAIGAVSVAISGDGQHAVAASHSDLWTWH